MKPSPGQTRNQNIRAAGVRSTIPALPVVICAAVLALGAVFFVWQRYQYVRIGFEVAELRRAKAKLEEVIEPLTVEVEYLSRLERIDNLAREKLGMRPPRVDQVMVIEKDVQRATPSK